MPYGIGHKEFCPLSFVAAERGIGVGKSLREYCEERALPELPEQWDHARNVDLTPETVAYASRKKIWWQCEKGHSWQAAVASRTAGGAGCPVCAGKVILPGFNDLASAYPAVAEQWHPTKNGSLTAQQVSPYSNRRVWWRCDLGHEWRTVISHRTAVGSKCPYCAGFKVLAGFNDLATLQPEVAKEWHPTLNQDLTPSMVMPGSHKRVWWECSAGHVWNAVVFSRTGSRKCGCPVCAGKVKAITDVK